jgi:hypothetical protein
MSQLDSFESEIKRFDAQFLSLHPAPLHEAFAAAETAYRSQPTDENFAALREVAINAVIIEKILPSSVLAIVHDAREKFIASQVIPFIRPILEKELAATQSRLNHVTTEEAGRHKRLTGQEFPGDSPICAAAREPITKIERLLGLENARKSPPLKGEMVVPSRPPRVAVMAAIEFLRAHSMAD